MLKLNRLQVIALGTLGMTLFACALAVGLSIGARSSAVEELAERQEIISRLQLQARQRSGAHVRVTAGTAPIVAFIDAPTSGLAAAQLQTYVARLAKEQQTTVTSSAVEPAARDDAPDFIRMQATLELSLKSLQAMLYQLESGTPYVFVELLSVQQSGAGQHGAEDPILRLTLGIRALWRRG